MRSVLRPDETSGGSSSSKSAGVKPQNKRRRRSFNIHWGAIAVSGLGLWLLGGVAWWQFQWWQPTRGESAEVETLPAHRIADQGNSELR